MTTAHTPAPALSPLGEYLYLRWVQTPPAGLIVVPEVNRGVRWAILLDCGPLVRDVVPGDRVLVSTLAVFDVADGYALVPAASVQLLGNDP